MAMNKPSMAQGKQIFDLLSKAEATGDQVQKLIENGDILRMLLDVSNLKDVDRKSLRKVLKVNPYILEEVESNYKYPSNYQPKLVSKQLAIFKQFYPRLDSKGVQELDIEIKDGFPMDQRAEMWQVVPKLSSIAKMYNIKDPYHSGYGSCLKIMTLCLECINNLKVVISHPPDCECKLRDGCEHAFYKKHIRLRPHSKVTLKRLEEKIDGDFLIFPMQSGKLYAGHSVRNARWKIEHNNQWALPSWVVGYHLMTHSKRLSTGTKLWIDCPGDEYSPFANEKFFYSLYFKFNVRLQLDNCDIMSIPEKIYGSASGFFK